MPRQTYDGRMDAGDWQQQLISNHGLRAVVAAELEWYAPPSLKPHSHTLPELDVPALDLQVLDLKELALHLGTQGFALHSLETERGPHQYELALLPTAQPLALAADLSRVRQVLRDWCAQQDRAVDFRAKPYPGHYGSALHVHVHLEDAEGNNVFSKDGDTLSDPLAFSIAGLLEKMEEHLPIFAPSAASSARFVAGWHAPVNSSWGSNNRTVALRLPDNTGGASGVADLLHYPPSRQRRIEHRVAGADADAGAVIAAILEAMDHGLRTQHLPPSPIHGDAADAKYGLKRFFE